MKQKISLIAGICLSYYVMGMGKLGLKCLKAALGTSPGTSTYSSIETQNCKIKKKKKKQRFI